MDLAKFISLLQTSCLYFSRADLLGDPFEGSITRPTLKALEVQAQAESVLHGFTQCIETHQQITRGARTSIFVNCWHMNSHESAAMWRLYSLADQGIAITTKYARLRDSLCEHIHLGKVNYVDYEQHAFPIDNLFNAFAHKRLSYAHEQEVRAVIWRPDLMHTQGIAGGWKETLGVLERIDLNELIDEVYVHPSSTEWYTDVVRGVIGKYGLDKKVHRSGLASTPIW